MVQYTKELVFLFRSKRKYHKLRVRAISYSSNKDSKNEENIAENFSVISELLISAGKTFTR